MRTTSYLTAVFVGAMALPAAFAQTAPATRPAASNAAGEETIELAEFVVSEGKSTGYRAANAITATGIGTKIADVPLAINVITSELISDIAGFEGREALNLVPGVLTNPRSESSVVVRGFAGLISYRNGQYRRQLNTTWNMDRVEVIKGPAAIFFGAVRPGGIVNYVTAKPSFKGTHTDVKVIGGSDDFYSASVFHNQVVNDKLAFLIGLGGIDANGARPYDYKHEGYAGGSVIWKPTSNQQLTLDLEIINRRVFYNSAYPGRALANSKIYGKVDAMTFQANLNRQNTSADTANRNYLTSLGYSGTFGAANFAPLYDMFAPYSYNAVLASDATQWQKSKTIDLDYLLKINDQLVWQTTLNYGFDDTDGLQPSDGDQRPYADGSLRFRTENFINIRDSYNVHNKLTYRFSLGPTNHTVQVGQEFQRVIFIRPGYLNSSNQYNDSPGNTGSSSTNPYVTYFIPGISQPASVQSIYNASGQTFNIIRWRWEDNSGYYIVDQARLFKDRLLILGGLRYNHFTGKIIYSKPISNSSLSSSSPGGLTNIDRVGAKGGLTPQAGALYKITNYLSAFATYSHSIEPNFSLDADGVSSEPVESKSWDFGLKTDLFDNRLTATLAYYDIDRTNLAYRDTAREIATGRSPYYIFGNAESSKGLEFDANYSPIDNYQIIFGWSHVGTAETTTSNNASFVGRRFGGIPKNTYVLWNRYTFSQEPLKNLSVALGIRHNDATNLSQDPNNAVTLPSFTVFDAMASYKLKLAGREAKLQLNIKNLADKKYREGADGFFAQPRTIYLSVETRF